MNNTLIVIGGPTAIGKTTLAIKIAKLFETEIISADSRQFYREMDIGTAKPSPEELRQVKHHFINSHSIHKPINAGEYEREAEELLAILFRKQNVVVAVGGSGLYIKALSSGLDQMPDIPTEIREDLNKSFDENGIQPLLAELEKNDPEYFSRVDINNPRRVIRALEVIRVSNETYTKWRNKSNKARNYNIIMIGLEMERELLYERIEKRIDIMLQNGLVNEVKDLINYRDSPALQTVGYTEVIGHIMEKYDMEECIRLLKRNTRRYAKRQMTWFKNQEDLIWFKATDIQGVLGYLSNRLSN